MKINFLKTKCYKLIVVINYFIPKKRQLVMASFPVIEDQLIAVLRWLRDSREFQIPVVFLIPGSANVLEIRRSLASLIGDYASKIKIYKKFWPIAVWNYWRSRFVFFTHGLYAHYKIPKKQSVINLWHAMPVKRTWLGPTDRNIPPCSLLISTSQEYSQILSLTSGLPLEKIPVTGLPRNDLLFSETVSLKLFRKDVSKGVKHVLLFLPTFRKAKVGGDMFDGVESETPLAMSAEEVDLLVKWLTKNDVRLLVKPHPMSVHYGETKKLNKYLWLVSDSYLHERGVCFYEVLGKVDAIITDASSVFVDYLSVDKPIFFYFPDISEYIKTRGFALGDIENWKAGPLAVNCNELLTNLSRWLDVGDDYQEKRKVLANRFNPQAATGSTEKIIRFLR